MTLGAAALALASLYALAGAAHVLFVIPWGRAHFFASRLIAPENATTTATGAIEWPAAARWAGGITIAVLVGLLWPLFDLAARHLRNEGKRALWRADSPISAGAEQLSHAGAHLPARETQDTSGGLGVSPRAS